MNQAVDPDEALGKVWSLINEARFALLVSVAEDGSLDSRPMGCVQHAFEARYGSSPLRALRK
jgi:general stress protein 26